MRDFHSRHPNIKGLLLPPDSVLEALHLRGDVLEVPERLPRLLHVSVLELRHHPRPHDLVGVWLEHEVAGGDVHLRD